MIKMNSGFIKVVSPDIAKELASLGFQYIKEQNVFVFPCSEELMEVILRQYDLSQFVNENKLRF